MPMIQVALVGAGGRSGCRVLDHLKNHPEYRVRPVEVSAEGQAELIRRGFRARPLEEAIPGADIIVLAVPDRVVGRVAGEVVHAARPGAMVLMFDAAAALGGQLPSRGDVTYFVAHACHPSMFDHAGSQAATEDYQGGTHAKHAVVCALVQGPEEHYALGERAARDVHGNVSRAHRVTVEQMGILSPALAEVCGLVLTGALREAMDEAVRRGVPPGAAADFMAGHLKYFLGIAFERYKHVVPQSDWLVAEYARDRILKPDWKSIFEPARVREQIEAITTGKLPSDS